MKKPKKIFIVERKVQLYSGGYRYGIQKHYHTVHASSESKAIKKLMKMLDMNKNPCKRHYGSDMTHTELSVIS